MAIHKKIISIISNLPKLWFIPIWILSYFLLIKILPEAFYWWKIPFLQNKYLILLVNFDNWFIILVALVFLPALITLFIFLILKKYSLINKIYRKRDINNFDKVNNSFGYVYIIKGWNEGLVKIGKTNNLKRRLIEAQNEQPKGTFTPNPIRLEYEHYQFSKYYHELERHIHRKLENKRYKPDTSNATEFFRLTPEEAKAELDIAIREIEEKMAS